MPQNLEPAARSGVHGLIALAAVRKYPQRPPPSKERRETTIKCDFHVVRHLSDEAANGLWNSSSHLFITQHDRCGEVRCLVRLDHFGGSIRTVRHIWDCQKIPVFCRVANLPVVEPQRSPNTHPLSRTVQFGPA